MAKKTKSKKAKAGTSKARTAKPSAPAVTPTYMPQGQTYTVGLHDVVMVLKVIEKHGLMSSFVKAAKYLQAAGTFDAKTVNFLKDFMAKHNLHTDPIGKHIVNARQAGPAAAAPQTGRFNCNFGSPLPGDSATPGLPRPKRK